MFGQSAFAGFLAAKAAGFVCDLMDADEETKRGVQACFCSGAGTFVGVVTLDFAGIALTAAQTGAYIAGKGQTSDGITSAIALLDAVTGQPKSHH